MFRPALSCAEPGPGTGGNCRARPAVEGVGPTVHWWRHSGPASHFGGPPKCPGVPASQWHPEEVARCVRHPPPGGRRPCGERLLRIRWLVDRNGGPAPQPPAHHQPPPPIYREQLEPTPYDGVTYQDPGVNPYLDPTEDRVSTFALDVDTASYTIAQRYVDDGFRQTRPVSGSKRSTHSTRISTAAR